MNIIGMSNVSFLTKNIQYTTLKLNFKFTERDKQMFKELRRKDRLMEEEKAYKLLNEGEYGVLSMTSTNGYGYGIPLNYVLSGNTLYFHCANQGSKIENLRENNKVSFCVVASSSPIANKFTSAYESVIVFGKVSEVDGDKKKEALILLLEKYSKGFVDEGKKMIKQYLQATKVIKVEIEHISGKCNKSE